MRRGQPTPFAYVADNDLAVGRVVEAISHSPFWNDTAILILEDDAQNGGDHVDAHRSLALLVSKYAPHPKTGEIAMVDPTGQVFDRQILDGMTLHAERFDFEPEVTAKVLRKKIRIYEVPISYAGREFDEGKKITWRDGFMALWTLVKYRFSE